MNKEIALFFVLVFLAITVFSHYCESADNGRSDKKTENVDPTPPDDDHFEGIVENTSLISEENFYGKYRKLFFGDTDSQVEFMYLPSSEAMIDGPHSGFRILANQTNKSYNIEVVRIINYEEVQKVLDEKYPTTTIIEGKYTEVEVKQLLKQNRSAWKKQDEESFSLYKIETQSMAVSKSFVDMLSKKMVLVMDCYQKHPGTPIDGYRVSFRTVTEQGVRTLNVHNPHDDSRVLSEICKKLTDDVFAKKFKESKYRNLLSKL